MQRITVYCGCSILCEFATLSLETHMLEREVCPPQALSLSEDSCQALCPPGTPLHCCSLGAAGKGPATSPSAQSPHCKIGFSLFLGKHLQDSFNKTNCGAYCRVYLKQITSSSSNNKLEAGWVFGTRVEPLCAHTGCGLGRSFSTWPACSSPLLGGYLPITLP